MGKTLENKEKETFKVMFPLPEERVGSVPACKALLHVCQWKPELLDGLAVLERPSFVPVLRFYSCLVFFECSHYLE